MKPEVTALLSKIRKRDRDLAELQKARQRMRDLKNPDAKLLKMIEDEIVELEKGQP